MSVSLRRLAGWALIVGTILATVGYLASSTLAGGTGDAHFTDPLFQPLYSIALAGDIIMVLGLPVILAYRARAARLHIVGYIGLYAALVMLNIGEGVIEGYVKPYLVNHGGIPADTPAGFSVFEWVALVCMLAGLICLGIAIIRAREFPIWVGILLIVSPLSSFLGLSGPWALISDYAAYAALFVIGLRAVRTEPAPARAASLAPTAA